MTGFVFLSLKISFNNHDYNDTIVCFLILQGNLYLHFVSDTNVYKARVLDLYRLASARRVCSFNCDNSYRKRNILNTKNLKKIMKYNEINIQNLYTFGTQHNELNI